jgi:putative hydrolase of the HAD superfamily
MNGGFFMIKAVVFDFDGLIIDTETVWYEAFKEVLQAYNVEYPLEEFVKVIGTHDALLNQFLEAKVGLAETAVVRKLAKESYLVKIQTSEIRDGVKDYLAAAQELGLKIGLASSSNRAWVEGYLKQLGIFDYFEVIKTGDQVEKVKPDPALYIKAIEELGVAADEAIAFEDSSNGAKAAKAAGLHCVIVPNEVTKSIIFDQYDLRIHSMSEMSLQDVIEYLEKICD